MNYIVFGNVEKICEHLREAGLIHGTDCIFGSCVIAVEIYNRHFWSVNEDVFVNELKRNCIPITFGEMVDLFPLPKPEKMIEVRGKKYSEDTLDEAMKQYVNK